MEKKYQTGIQKTILDIIKQSRDMQLSYITKKQIIDELKQRIVGIDHPESKVGQALRIMQHKTVWKQPRVKKVFDDKGHRVGWTVADDPFQWSNQ